MVEVQHLIITYMLHVEVGLTENCKTKRALCVNMMIIIIIIIQVIYSDCPFPRMIRLDDGFMALVTPHRHGKRKAVRVE